MSAEGPLEDSTREDEADQRAARREARHALIITTVEHLRSQATGFCAVGDPEDVVAAFGFDSAADMLEQLARKLADPVWLFAEDLLGRLVSSTRPISHRPSDDDGEPK